MLNVMRDNLRHLKWVLWIVAISLVAYLGAFFSCDPDRRGGLEAGWAAQVNGEPISRTEFLRTARNLRDYYRQMFGDQFEQFRPALQIGNESIRTLVNRRIMLAEAKKLGLEATPEEISRRIVENPAFQGADGKFVGRQVYTRLLSRGVPGGVTAYEQSVAEDIVIQQWADLITYPVRVGDDEIRKAYEDRNVTTEVDYVVVASADQDVSTEISEEEEREWYESHRDDYRRDEGRRIRFVTLSRQDQISKIEVSEADVEGFYDQSQAEFARPEQRRARHILIKVEPGAPEEAKTAARREAEQLLERIRNGESLETLAGQFSEDEGSAQRGGDLGFFERGRMVPEFDRAVWETPVGEYAPVVETGFGFHVIQVTDERKAGVVPLEEVREQIRAQLRQRRAADRVESEAARIRDAIMAGEDLDGVAETEELAVEELVVRREDRLTDLGAGPDFIGAIFALEPDQVSEPLRVRQGRVIARLVGTESAAVAPLEEVRSQVRTDLMNDRGRRASLEAARAALERTGEDLDKAARRLGQDVRSSGRLTPPSVLPGAGGTSPELKEALFGSGARENSSGVAPVPAGAVVYRVTSHTPFDPVAFESAKEQLRDELRSTRRDELLGSILAKLREQYEVLVNDELVNSLST